MEDSRFGALVGRTVLVPTPDDPETPGTWTLVERDVLSTLMEEDDLGLLMPAFTSPEALGRWRPEGGAYVERDSAWFFGVAAADPEGRAVIDPGSVDALVVPPNAVAALAAGQDPEAGGQILVATPIEGLAAEVAEPVRTALAAEPSVASARVFLIDAGTGQDLVVFVDLGAAAPEEVAAAMGRIMERIAATTDRAAGLRFQVVDDDWRPTYESGGLPLLER